MMQHDGAPDDIADLKARLREAEETLDAIRNGDVDAVVVGGPSGQQVYTLENADRPYRVLVEQMQEGAVTLGRDGTVLYCNQRFASIVRATRSTIVGEAIGRFFGTSERPLFHQALTRMRDEQGFAAEFTLVAADGKEVPVNLSLVDLHVDEGTPRVVCGVVTDLTQNRRRGHELAAANRQLASEIEERRRAEDGLQLALDAAGMGSWDLDLVTGLVHRSLRHDQIFGHDAPIPVWTLESSLDQFVDVDRAFVETAFAQAPQSGLIDLDKRIRRASDGAIRWVHLKGRAYGDGGAVTRLAGVVSDITDRRLIEEQLRQAQKMEAVGQLTGGIAHDFNNLLMIIGGSLEMLGRRLPPDERTGRLLEAASRGVARGAKLNQQLLAFSRRQDLRAESVSIGDLIPTFQHLLDRALGETITIRLRTAPDNWFCRTDPNQLETAILNLAINARDAMPSGGAVTLSTENRVIDERTAAAWGASAGDYVAVSVGDTGIGMAPDVLSRVFEPFFTTKDVGKGTGLGLSQVYGFAKQSNGFVTIESEPGRGTEVFIHLPRTRQPEAAGNGQAAAVASTDEKAGQGTILVVEDDAEVRATTSGLLQDLGYDVREAETGRMALALVEQGEPIDLVFTDVIMPDGMSGIELARELGRRRPDLPILLTSGYTAQRGVPEAVATQLRVLRKPYDQSQLATAVRDTIGLGIKAARG